MEPDDELGVLAGRKAVVEQEPAFRRDHEPRRIEYRARRTGRGLAIPGAPGARRGPLASRLLGQDQN